MSSNTGRLSLYRMQLITSHLDTGVLSVYRTGYVSHRRECFASCTLAGLRDSDL